MAVKPFKARKQVSTRKLAGVHYTPTRLARFLAERLAQHVDSNGAVPLRILDPACGDGELLASAIDVFRGYSFARIEVCGVESDAIAAEAARARLAGTGAVEVRIFREDFLTLSAVEEGQRQFWEPEQPNSEFYRSFDVVIANPPYVRTQVLGAEASQRLAARFGLQGRVDLYHAFWVAMSEALKHNGVIGIITSNRFLTTLSGAGIRRFLTRAFSIDEVIDLGDTKLFEAAVLPAIFVGRRRLPGRAQDASRRQRFVKVYSCDDSNDESKVRTAPSRSVLDVIDHDATGRFAVAEGTFDVTRCRLQTDCNGDSVWTLTTLEEADWLQRVKSVSGQSFGDVAQVRVGVKTTADGVFMRSDWESLPREMSPEDELLRPLLTHECARRWVGRTPRGARARILYPHHMVDGLRRPIDLDRYPRARAYLESNRARLTARSYVIDAGRQWYEIWVPQDPAAWSKPKIVVPDISPESRFYFDDSGSIVDGDSYWIATRPGVNGEALYLLLALANSRLMARFHDLSFNNRLYSGRRRYITQYIAKYPLPKLPSIETADLIACVRKFISFYDPLSWFSSQKVGVFDEV